MKRNSWFIVEHREEVDVFSHKWIPSPKKILQQMRKGEQAHGVFTNLSMEVSITDVRYYFVADPENVDHLEGMSTWTRFRREAMKFQSKQDAEKYAYELTQRFPPYIGRITVERLRWNPGATGPIEPIGPTVGMALAT